MPLYRAQHVLPFFTNLPTDVVVNQFHFTNDTQNFAAVATEIRDRIQGFMEAAYGAAGGSRVSYIDWPQAVVKVFNLADPTPRVPEVRACSYSAGTVASAIPTEVAAVVSWHAAPESGVAFQRLYNRIYLGGVPAIWMSNGAADQFPRFTTTITAQIAAAASALLAENDGVTDWVQVSNAGGVTAAREITGGWVDNGPDTQRRRSVLASLRDVWT